MLFRHLWDDAEGIFCAAVRQCNGGSDSGGQQLYCRLDAITHRGCKRPDATASPAEQRAKLGRHAGQLLRHRRSADPSFVTDTSSASRKIVILTRGIACETQWSCWSAAPSLLRAPTARRPAPQAPPVRGVLVPPVLSPRWSAALLLSPAVVHNTMVVSNIRCARVGR